jgi:ubiquinone/menaquinone biosynthesis C-methylase UbiE
MGAEAMAEQLFDTWPEKYEKWFRTPIGRLVQSIELGHIMDLLAPGRQDRILDVGCGTGVFTEAYLRQGARVAGVDLSLEMLRYGLQKPELSGMLPAVADMRRLPFADGSFDKTVSITAIEFVADGRRAVQELLRVTRKDGRLVIATLNRLSPWANRRRQEARQDPDSVFRHVHFRSPDELSRLVDLEGEIRTAIHFNKDASLQQAKAEEERYRHTALERGAFVVGAWDRP